MITVKTIVIDNVPKIKEMSKAAKQIALIKIGLAAEGYAKRLVPTDTSRLKNSITFATHSHIQKGASPATPKDYTPRGQVDEDSVILGTNVEYAVYQELGTGIYASEGNGRKTPWWYQDDKGVWHKTSGTKPKHFIRDAMASHTQEYKTLIENTYKQFNP